MLTEQKAACLYQSDEWMTFVQARQCGRKVKKGAKGIMLHRVLEGTDEKNERKRGYKRFVVFNLDQLEELPK
jgi:antirestriction protein ArdC